MKVKILQSFNRAGTDYAPNQEIEFPAVVARMLAESGLVELLKREKLQPRPRKRKMSTGGSENK